MKIALDRFKSGSDLVKEGKMTRGHWEPLDLGREGWATIGSRKNIVIPFLLICFITFLFYYFFPFKFDLRVRGILSISALASLI